MPFDAGRDPFGRDPNTAEYVGEIARELAKIALGRRRSPQASGTPRQSHADEEALERAENDECSPTALASGS